MLRSNFVQSFILSTVTTLLLLSLISVGQAEVRSSSNFQLQSDSINIGGGLSSSTSFVQESTVGEIATGPSDSSNYSLRAGYQQMQEVFLSLSLTGDVTMSPSLPGFTGGTSNGSTTLTVITDSPSGYQVTIAAENDPAMQSGSNTIADYSAGANPDFSLTTNPTDAHLAYSPEGNDIADRFKDDGGTCAQGSLDTALACWDGLSTTDAAFVYAPGANHPGGATTTLNFRVDIGGNANVQTGVYTATTTITALPL
tara:strand:- start:1077 stop:1841 length:765 start_codon:yes stop_codon:yes gene_type:complete